MSFLTYEERHAELLKREQDVRKALDDIQQFRSALAADRERVRSVVAAEARRVLYESDLQSDLVPVADAIATRAAEQLATAAPALSADERKQLERHIRDFRATCSYSCSIIERLINGQGDTAAVGLSEEDRVRLRNIADLLRKQPACWDMEAALLDRLLGASK